MRVRLNLVLDSVAALRQRRLSRDPDPLAAATLAAQAGVDGVTLWLRTSRSEVQDQDVELVVQAAARPLNLRIAATDELLAVAARVRPASCCIVPEHRHDHAPGGGLDAVRLAPRLEAVSRRLADLGIETSARIDPVLEQVEACIAAGLRSVELHSGGYALAVAGAAVSRRLADLRAASRAAAAAGIAVSVGGGLDYHNVAAVGAIDEITEVRVGHAIVANALIAGLVASIAQFRVLLARGESVS